MYCYIYEILLLLFLSFFFFNGLNVRTSKIFKREPNTEHSFISLKFSFLKGHIKKLSGSFLFIWNLSVYGQSYIQNSYPHWRAVQTNNVDQNLYLSLLSRIQNLLEVSAHVIFPSVTVTWNTLEQLLPNKHPNASPCFRIPQKQSAPANESSPPLQRQE